MRREPGARECNGYSADEEMDGSASREAEEPRALGSANGIGAKYRRAQDSGGGGGNGYHRPMGRGPGGDGSYYRPAARVPGGEGAYYRPMWRTPGLEGKTRSANHLHRGERRGFGREFGRRFERRPGDGAMNGYAGGSRRWKPRPGGREYAGGLGARIREDEGGRESPASQDEGEGNRGAGEEEEGEQAVEERWTLFKPPAAFPVDSSTARTVPRISYASKVKENLSRTGPLAPESGGGASDDSSGSEGGPRRSPGPAHSLGAIFHNQWGLSFITEPGPGRESSETHGRTGLNSQPPDPGPGHPGGLGPGCFPVNRLSPSCERWSASHTLDLQAVVLYFSTEWDRIWDRHKRDPSAVVLYEESLDSAGLTD